MRWVRLTIKRNEDARRDYPNLESQRMDSRVRKRGIVSPENVVTSSGTNLMLFQSLERDGRGEDHAPPSIHGSPANGGAGAESRLRTAVGAALSRRTGQDRSGISARQPMKPGLCATAICTVRQRALGSAAAPAGSFVFVWRGGRGREI